MAELTKAVRKTQRDPAFQFLGEPITYRTVTHSTDRGTGVDTPTNDDTIIGTNTDDDPGALISAVTEDMVAKSGGAILPDDLIVRIRQSDIPEEPPKLTSKVLRSSDGVVRDVMDFKLTSDENIYILTVRKV